MWQESIQNPIDLRMAKTRFSLLEEMALLLSVLGSWNHTGREMRGIALEVSISSEIHRVAFKL